MLVLSFFVMCVIVFVLVVVLVVVLVAVCLCYTDIEQGVNKERGILTRLCGILTDNANVWCECGTKRGRQRNKYRDPIQHPPTITTHHPKEIKKEHDLCPRPCPCPTSSQNERVRE